MKADDIITGAILFVFAVAMTAYAQTFPVLAGMSVGPDLFPTVIGVGLALCGLILMVKGWIVRRRTGAPLPWVAIAPWARQPRAWLNAACVLAALVFYVYASRPLGFHLTAAVILLGLLLRLGVRPAPAAVTAVVCPVVVHWVFYDILRVPLPWRVLEPVAW